MTDDLLSRAAPFLNQCGPCDYGLPTSCTCCDYRPVMLELVREVERLRSEHEPRRGSNVDAWLKRHREEYRDSDGSRTGAWHAIDGVLDDYRDHADVGQPLGDATPIGPHSEESG